MISWSFSQQFSRKSHDHRSLKVLRNAVANILLEQLFTTFYRDYFSNLLSSVNLNWRRRGLVVDLLIQFRRVWSWRSELDEKWTNNHFPIVCSKNQSHIERHFVIFLNELSRCKVNVVLRGIPYQYQNWKYKAQMKRHRFLMIRNAVNQIIMFLMILGTNFGVLLRQKSPPRTKKRKLRSISFQNNFFLINFITLISLERWVYDWKCRKYSFENIWLRASNLSLWSENLFLRNFKHKYKIFWIKQFVSTSCA